MRYHKSISSNLIITLICLSSVFCGQRQQPVENREVKTKRDSVLDDAQKKRTAWAAKLQAMGVQQLVEQLAKESTAGLEPFNSTAYKELISRGQPAYDSIASLITANDRSSLLVLLALRRIDKEKYLAFSANRKSLIFSDALGKAAKFNTFGLPNVKWEEAAMAMIESGDTVRLALYPLLKDQRPAPVWGSEDYAEYMTYKYRVCDYAFGILSTNRERAINIELPKEPGERDRMIQGLLNR